jgi:hypothetical protein
MGASLPAYQSSRYMLSRLLEGDPEPMTSL